MNLFKDSCCPGTGKGGEQLALLTKGLALPLSSSSALVDSIPSEA